MTATGSERCTATPWRGSGRGFGTSSGRSGVSTKRTENSTSSFSRGLTTSRRSPTSSCGYCSDAREPPNWLLEPRQLSALDKVEGHGPGHDQREGAEVPALPFLSANRGRKEPWDRENPAVPHLKTEEPKFLGQSGRRYLIATRRGELASF